MSEENIQITEKNATLNVPGRSLNISQLFKKRFTNYFVERAKKNLNKNV